MQLQLTWLLLAHLLHQRNRQKKKQHNSLVLMDHHQLTRSAIVLHYCHFYD